MALTIMRDDGVTQFSQTNVLTFSYILSSLLLPSPIMSSCYFQAFSHCGVVRGQTLGAAGRTKHTHTHIQNQNYWGAVKWMNLEPKNRGNEKVTDIKRDVVVQRKAPVGKRQMLLFGLRHWGQPDMCKNDLDRWIKSLLMKTHTRNFQGICTSHGKIIWQNSQLPLHNINYTVVT